jgi:hypothetical protein
MPSPFRNNKKARRRSRKSVAKLLTLESREGVDPRIVASVKRSAGLLARMGQARRKKKPQSN